MTTIPEKYSYYANKLQAKDIMNINDIQGTKAGSLQKSSLRTSQRNVNPLEPNYKYPGTFDFQNSGEKGNN